VGRPPSTIHSLRRKDAREPWGPDNCFWRERIPSEDKAKYQRDWRKVNLRRVIDYDLKRRFGISVDRYDELLGIQNGVCAICGNAESIITKSGKERMLAVDHGKDDTVRGLLCTGCNTGIGCFDHDVKRLKKAIVYLERGA